MHTSPVRIFLALAIATGGSFVAACGSSSSGSPIDGSSAPICPVKDDLISDFAMDNGVYPVDGRQGGWYTYGDRSGLGELIPAEGGGAPPDTMEGNPACSGPGSLHVKATGFADWGAAMGVDFMPKTKNPEDANAKGTYDATRYKGISFYAKAAAPVKFALVKLLDPYTEIPSVLPTADWCAYRPMQPVNCSPYVVKFGYGYTGEDAMAIAEDYPKYKDTVIDTNWKRFEILFSDAKQDRFNPGKKAPGDVLAVAQLVGMAIQVNSDHSTTPPTPNDFEIWVDDVAFVPK